MQHEHIDGSGFLMLSGVSGLSGFYVLADVIL